jgi:hypothetical protein
MQVRDGLPYVTVTLLYGGQQLDLANVLLDTETRPSSPCSRSSMRARRGCSAFVVLWCIIVSTLTTTMNRVD